MHTADALISPAVGGTMWAAAAGLTVNSARQLKKEMDERKIPLMGVSGALVFAARMVSFTIPGTGSSGRFGGGLLPAILLGPHAAFLGLKSARPFLTTHSPLPTRFFRISSTLYASLQSSSTSPGTRSNSFLLFVTNIRPDALA